MTFQKSDWVNREFSDRFVSIAGVQIPLRSWFFRTIASFHLNHPRTGQGAHILDLECGDGAVSHAIRREDPRVRLTLVDASPDMLAKAREHLAGVPGCTFLQTSFEDLIRVRPALGPFDIVVSSLAVHHITAEEKEALFAFLHGVLHPGGWILIYDSVLPPAAHEAWYIQFWREWIREEQARTGMTGDLEGLIDTHHQTPAHHATLDTLPFYINAVTNAGFTNVDCVMKFGIFALIVGQKS
jgi:tRNA (cmo5U34)-methyltransferase